MPVKPIKGTIVLLAVATPPTRELLVSERGSVYPRRDDKLLVGATVEDIGYDKEVRLGSVQALARQAVALLPALKDAVVAGSWAGLRPFSHDNLPYLALSPGCAARTPRPATSAPACCWRRSRACCSPR